MGFGCFDRTLVHTLWTTRYTWLYFCEQHITLGCTLVHILWTTHCFGTTPSRYIMSLAVHCLHSCPCWCTFNTPQCMQCYGQHFKYFCVTVSQSKVFGISQIIRWRFQVFPDPWPVFCRHALNLPILHTGGCSFADSHAPVLVQSCALARSEWSDWMRSFMRLSNALELRALSFNLTTNPPWLLIPLRLASWLVRHSFHIIPLQKRALSRTLGSEFFLQGTFQRKRISHWS